MNTLQQEFNKLQSKIEQSTFNEFDLSKKPDLELTELVQNHVSQLEISIRTRIEKELFGWGPLEDILNDESVSEILINGSQSIWYEKAGQLYPFSDQFLSRHSFRNITEKICQKAGINLTIESPIGDGSFSDFRVSAIKDDISRQGTHLSLRRHPKNPWNFQRLLAEKWCDSQDLSLFEKLIEEKSNFLIVGATSSGKTSIINSFLGLTKPNERVLVIEDSSEIALPNSASMKLLTRPESQGNMNEINQAHLVKAALRLRPDRIVMGEIRAHEAKDFLMAVATGHNGSFGSLHAQDPHQALIRLEMLVQMGAPQWNINAIRKLIRLSLDYILVTERTRDGQRKFKSCYRICSLEENGFLIEEVTGE